MSRSSIIRINRSTSHVPLWSPTGMNITLKFCSWPNSRTSLEINPDPWFVLIILGNPCRFIYFLRKFITNVADVLDYFCAEGNFENRSTDTSINIFVTQVKGSGPAKWNSISWFGSTTEGSFPRSSCIEISFKFLSASTHSMQFSWISR